MHFRPAIIAALAVVALLAASCGGVSLSGAVEGSLSKNAGGPSYSKTFDRRDKPSSLSPGDAVFTAYWLKERSGGLVKERLYLTFDNEKKILRAYRYTSKPSL